MESIRPREDQPPAGSRATWDRAIIGAALGARGEERADVAYGIGTAYRVAGRAQPVAVELFPDALAGGGVVRITTTDIQISLFRQAAPIVEPTGVIFECPVQLQQTERWVSVSATGEVVLFLTPPPSNQETSPKGASSVDAPQSVQEGIQQQPSRAPVAADQPPGEVAQHQIPSSKIASEEQQPRISLTAVRLGTDIRFKTLRDGRILAEFPVAERREGEVQATWHNVVVFGSRAEQLQREGTIGKGSAVDIVGYVHTTYATGRDGKLKTKRAIYATAVVPR